ncbi:carbohydrate-binding family 9-like protein [Aestuariivivens sediminis]|uniref:carbohydrate-binding family 9-like protein n=1 Tax=Aestuariivivens sediminis TaxID=2913557 RepID=UPI001F586470|nr:carbohydrate-binding family 9-like protein [Aestuariivivens sediminis]
MDIYQVNRVSEDFCINGNGDSPFWMEAHVLSDFKSPWDQKEIAPIEFRALHNSKHLFFYFRVKDTDVYIDQKDDTKASINNSDRVELFFRQDKNLRPYYCLEIDPSPRIMDFIAQPNRQFDFNWDWPKSDINVQSSFDSKGFTVEGAISMTSLKAFKLINENVIEAGIYRAKYHKQSDGRYEPAWITWIDPNTKTPDFHIASSFGILHLED